MFSKRSRHLVSLPMLQSRGDWFVAAACCLIVFAGTCRGDDGAADVDAEKAERTPAQLSVAPLEFPSYPADRPDWIDQPPRLDGAVHQWPVVSVPSLNRDRCRESLREQTRIAISLYASHLFSDDHLATVDALRNEPATYPSYLYGEDSGQMQSPLKIKESRVRAFLDNAERSYFGSVGTSDGEMFEEAALLHFDETFRDELKAEYRNQQVGSRLTRLGVLSGGSMALLVGLSAVLRWAGFRKR